MSEFIREVDEEYRRERAINFLKRYQVPLVVVVVLIVAGAAGWRWYVDHRTAQAQSADARYQKAGTQARSGQTAEAAATYKALAASGPAGYALLARLRAAEVLAATDPEAAAKQLDTIASDDGAGSPALRDLARYRGALLRVDTMDPKAFDAQYGRFALETFALHDGMRELLALVALKRGDDKAAAKYLDDLIVDPLTPPALRNRAQAYREIVNAGPATKMTSPPGPANVTPINPATGKPASSAAAPPAEDNIAPVETLPPAADMKSKPPAPAEPATPAPPSAPSRTDTPAESAR